MNKLFVRIGAILLVPCLLGQDLGVMSRLDSALLNRHSSLPFTEQALSVAPVAGFRNPGDRRAVHVVTGLVSLFKGDKGEPGGGHAESGPPDTNPSGAMNSTQPLAKPPLLQWLKDNFGVESTVALGRTTMDPSRLPALEWAMDQAREPADGLIFDLEHLPSYTLRYPLAESPWLSSNPEEEALSQSDGVYLGLVEGIAHPVAIKVFKKGWSAYKMEFEIVCSQIMAHSGIGPKIYGRIDLPDGRVAYAMEVVRGKEVSYYAMERNPPLLEEYRTLPERLALAGLRPTGRRVTPTRHLVYVDAGDCNLQNRNMFLAYLRNQADPASWPKLAQLYRISENSPTPLAESSIPRDSSGHENKPYYRQSVGRTSSPVSFKPEGRIGEESTHRGTLREMEAYLVQQLHAARHWLDPHERQRVEALRTVFEAEIRPAFSDMKRLTEYLGSLDAPPSSPFQRWARMAAAACLSLPAKRIIFYAPNNVLVALLNRGRNIDGCADVFVDEAGHFWHFAFICNRLPDLAAVRVIAHEAVHVAQSLNVRKKYGEPLVRGIIEGFQFLRENEMTQRMMRKNPLLNDRWLEKVARLYYSGQKTLSDAQIKEYFAEVKTKSVYPAETALVDALIAKAGEASVRSLHQDGDFDTLPKNLGRQRWDGLGLFLRQWEEVFGAANSARDFGLVLARQLFVESAYYSPLFTPLYLRAIAILHEVILQEVVWRRVRATKGDFFDNADANHVPVDPLKSLFVRYASAPMSEETFRHDLIDIVGHLRSAKEVLIPRPGGGGGLTEARSTLEAALRRLELLHGRRKITGRLIAPTRQYLAGISDLTSLSDDQKTRLAFEGWMLRNRWNNAVHFENNVLVKGVLEAVAVYAAELGRALGKPRQDLPVGVVRNVEEARLFWQEVVQFRPGVSIVEIGLRDPGNKKDKRVDLFDLFGRVDKTRPVIQSHENREARKLRWVFGPTVHAAAEAALTAVLNQPFRSLATSLQEFSVPQEIVRQVLAWKTASPLDGFGVLARLLGREAWDALAIKVREASALTSRPLEKAA